MKNFLTKHKSALIKTLVLLLILVAISFLIFGIMFWTGIVYYDEGFTFDTALFAHLTTEWWFYLVFLLIQVVLTILLCFAPAGSMLFIILAISLFGPTWETFLLVFAGVIISSLLMDILGRFGGVKLVTWLIGKEEYESALNLLTTKKYTYLPFMYLLPIFPDDALCMVAGMSKIKFWIHAIMIILCRGIGVATIVFGANLIPYQDFTTFYEWFIFGAAIIVYVFILFKFAKFLDKKLSLWLEKRQNKDNKD